MKLKKLFFSCLVCIFIFVFAFADNLQMDSSVSKTTVALNETFQLTVSFTTDSKSLPDFTIPQLNDFNIYSTSQSKNISIINGKVKNTVYYVYTLSPKKMGEFYIPPFTLNYQGERYETKEIKITVEKAKTVSSVPASQTSAGNASSSTNGNLVQNNKQPVYNLDTTKAVFVQATTDKKTAYVNEKIIYTFYFYTSVNILSNPAYRGPDFSGFFIGETSQKNYRTYIKGREYVVTEVSTELFPQKPGTLTIDKAMLQVSIEDFSKMHDDFFASFFRSARAVDLATDEIKIKVLQTPADVDMIGKYNISAFVDKKQKKVDEPFDLIIKITGNGNIKTIKEPEIMLSENLKKYETSEQIIKDGEKETGKQFTTLIMPLEQGEGTIKILPMKYFDLETKITKSLPQKQIQVQIDENKDRKIQQPVAEQTIEADSTKQNQLPQNMDLSFLFKIYAIVTSAMFWKIVGLLVLLYLIIKLLLRYRAYLNKDQQKLKNKKAYRKSKKYFQKAKKAKNTKDFYENMYKGLLEYFASVLGQSAEGLTSYKIGMGLKDKNIDDNLITEVDGILEECTMFLYAKQSDNLTKQDYNKFYNKTFDILKKMP
ncbi:BatD family protein [Candidatus Ruminimicrobium bovinum]|uniref:BatD family protein n=1 Tax=Candidatus Ruminimicrobium bovinum TaxID=3242779 RepID=UPI0039B91661